MSERVFVSGYGVVSALGFGVKSNLEALLNETHGLSNPQYLKTENSNFIVGEVKASNAELQSRLDVDFPSDNSRTALLGLIAAHEAVQMANMDADLLAKTGFYSGTSVGGMDLTENQYKSMMADGAANYKKYFEKHDCGYSTEVIANALGLKGTLSTISTACSSSANTIMQAARMIKSGKADCVVAGGTDALSRFTLNGFNSLMIHDVDYCKPFDQNRKGLNLGEGAAYLVLESESSLRKRNHTPLGEVVGYGNSNDAYHQTASSPEGRGAANSIRKALAVAGLSPDAIDYVNAHGTGTKNNDESESLALKTIFDGAVPPYSSTKCFTGHTLAAAGAIEAVYSLLAIEKQMVFANPNVVDPMGIIQPPVAKTREESITHVLSNSFGFGGNCSAIIYSKA